MPALVRTGWVKRMRMWPAVMLSVLLAAALGGVGCGRHGSAAGSAEPGHPHVLRIGVCPGPYGRMVEEALAPVLMRQQIRVEVVSFTDYLQPDIALDSGMIDANLMQHQRYLDGIVREQGFGLAAVISVPTLGMGVFSQRYRALKELRAGDTIALPRDHVNQERALRLAASLGMLTLPESDGSGRLATVQDIADNRYGAEYVPLPSHKLAESLLSHAVAFVPGNYAVAAALDYSTALGVEELQEEFKNVIAVRKDDLQTLGEVLREAVRSDEFRAAIDGHAFYSGFSRPQWWTEAAPGMPCHAPSCSAAAQ